MSEDSRTYSKHCLTEKSEENIFEVMNQGRVTRIVNQIWAICKTKWMWNFKQLKVKN